MYRRAKLMFGGRRATLDRRGTGRPRGTARADRQGRHTEVRSRTSSGHHLEPRLRQARRARPRGHERSPPATSDRKDDRHGSPRRHPRPARRPRRPVGPRHGVLHRAPRPVGGRAARRLRHVGPPRVVAVDVVQRRPHRRDHAGDLRVPQGAGHRRAALHRQGHPRALRAGDSDRARGARGQRRDRARRRPRRLDAHAGRVARDPHLQPRPHQRARRRHRRHPVAQPAGRRRLQVQPAARRPRRHRRHELDRRPRQPAARGEARRRRTRHPRQGAWRPTPPAPTTSSTGTSSDLPVGPGPRRHPRLRPAHRRRPAGRRLRRLLGRDRRALRARPHGREPVGGRHVPVHDPRLGRQDPHGLLVAVGDGRR